MQADNNALNSGKPAALSGRLLPIADELYAALRAGSTVEPLTARNPALSLSDAYQVSLAILDRRLRNDGERLVGKKIGVTSKAIQEMFNVFQPDYGFLTDAMSFANGVCIPIENTLIQPRAEGEIAFRLRKDLNGPGITETDVLDATETVLPCFEIVDSRIRDWQIRIEDTIADNASCGVFVLGDREVDPRKLSLPDLRMQIFRNANLESEGRGSAVQGNPLTAVAWLANTLGSFDMPLKAGEIILSGALGPMFPVAAGDTLSMVIEGLGGCSCSFS